MPKYCLGQTAPNGRREYLAVEADTPGDAVRLQRSLGFRDVIYYTPWIDNGLSVKDHIRFLTMASFEAFRWYLLKIIFIMRGLFLLFYMVVAYFSFKDGINSISVILFSIPLMVVTYFAAKGAFFGPPNLLQKLGSLMCWCRWQEALNFLPRLKNYISSFEYAMNQAAAFTGLGNLNEALDILKPFADDPEIPQWAFALTLARISVIAQQPANAIKYFQEAIALNPTDDDLKLEYAGMLVRLQKRNLDAQRVLEQTDLDGLCEWQLGLLSALRGNIELQRKHFAGAINHYQESLKILNLYGVTRPDLKVTIDLVHARLCLAYAGSGDQAQAQQHFQIAKRRLHLPPYAELLLECETALAS